MFTVSAQVRTAVVDFFVEVYETFASLFIEDNNANENPKTLETKYNTTYFKKSGYTKINQMNSTFKSVEIWSKNDISVDFSQYVIENSDITLDTEDASYEIKHIDNQKIYYKVKNNSYTIKWLAYGYSFNLRCDESLGWEEIEKIITSLEPVTE